MSVKQFTSDVLDIDQDDLKEVLRCMIHTILFQRALGLIKPKDYLIEILDFYYVQCDHPELMKRIEERIDAIVSNFLKKPKDTLQVEISFHHKVEKSKQSWFGKNEMVCWEQWFINFKISKPAPKTPDRRDQLESQLRERVIWALQMSTENRNHIPPLTTNEVAPFPFKISTEQSSDKWYGVFIDIFKGANPDIVS